MLLAFHIGVAALHFLLAPTPEVLYQLGPLYKVSPQLMKATAKVESEESVWANRSSKGACCMLQVLGARFKRPSCDLLELAPTLCALIALREMAYWRGLCSEEWMLPAYNAGFVNCCGGWWYRKNKDTQPDGFFWCDTSFREKVLSKLE